MVNRLLDLVPRIGLELAQAERNLLLLLVDAEHDGFDFLAHGEDVGRTHDALRPGQLGNVDEAFDAFLQFHERAVRNEVGDLAFDLLAGRETLFDLVPGILLRLLQAEGNALLLLVDVEHEDFELLTDLEQFARMAEAAPGHVGDVEQAVHAVEIDERAEIGEVLDRARDGVADLDAFEEFLALLAPLLLDQFAPAKHDVLPVVVDLDDFEIVGVADKLLEIPRRDDVDLRGGQERFDADVDHEAAFDDGLDLALDQAVAGKDLRDLVPVLAIGGFLLREDDHAFVVFEAFEEHFHFVADFERLDVVKLRCRNDALRLVTDVDEHFAWPNLQNAPFDDAAFFEVAHRLRHQILHLQHKR